MITPKIKIPENVSNTYTLSEPTATTKNELAEWVCNGLEKIKEKYLFEMCSESLRIKIENEVNRLIEMCENRMLEIGLIQHYPFNNKQYCFINFVDYGREVLINFNIHGEFLLKKLELELE